MTAFWIGDVVAETGNSSSELLVNSRWRCPHQNSGKRHRGITYVEVPHKIRRANTKGKNAKKDRGINSATVPCVSNTSTWASVCLCLLYVQISVVYAITFQKMFTGDSAVFETFPVYLALILIFAYIGLCSLIFCLWEEWDYFTAFYFFCVSLMTIGLGDEMPQHPRYACGQWVSYFMGLFHILRVRKYRLLAPCCLSLKHVICVEMFK